MIYEYKLQSFFYYYSSNRGDGRLLKFIRRKVAGTKPRKNRIEILALRDFARKIRPRGVWFDLRLDGALVETFSAVSADKNQTASFIHVDKRTSVQEPLRILGWDAQTFGELKPN